MLTEEQRIDACNKRLRKAQTTLADLTRHMDAFDLEFAAMCECARRAGIIIKVGGDRLSKAQHVRPGEVPGTLEREDKP